MEQSYCAFLTMDSYIYGFTLQETSVPFEPEERPELVERLRPAIPPDEYPHVVSMMQFVLERSSSRDRRGSSTPEGYSADFEFGLDLIFEGLERRLRSRR